MESTELKEVFATLETHTAWKDSMSRMQDAYNASPEHVSGDTSAKELRKQLAYLDSQEVEDSARSALVVEIASNPHLLPLPYLLGSIAAFQATKSPKLNKNLGGGRLILSGMDDIFRGSNNYSGLGSKEAQKILPSNDVATRAVQIGDELVRLSEIFGKKDKVPIAMVWHNDYSPPRISYSEVVTGTVTQGAFKLVPPTIGSRGVKHHIPTRLTRVTKGEVITADEYVQKEEKYTNAPITSVAKLLGKDDRDAGFSDPNVVYIGKKDVKDRIQQARKEDVARNLRYRQMEEAYRNENRKGSKLR